MDEKKVELTFNWWKKFKPTKDKTPKIDSELTRYEVAMDQLDFETARSSLRHIEKEWKPLNDALKKSKVKTEKDAAKRIQAELEARHEWLRDRMGEAAKRAAAQDDDDGSEEDDSDEESGESESEDSTEVIDEGKEFVWRRDVSKDLEAKAGQFEALGMPSGWVIALEIPDIAFNKKGKPRVLLTALLAERLEEVYQAYLERLCNQFLQIDAALAGDIKAENADEQRQQKLLAAARSNAEKLEEKFTQTLEKTYQKTLLEYITDKNIYESYKRKKKFKIALASVGIAIASAAATITAATGIGWVIAIPIIAAVRGLNGLISDLKDNHTKVAKVEANVIKSLNSLAKSLTNLKEEVANAKQKAKEEGVSEDEIWEEQSKVLKGVKDAKEEVVTRKGQRLKSALSVAIRTVTGQRHTIVTTSLNLSDEMGLWKDKLSEAQISAEHMAREVLKLMEKIDKAAKKLQDEKSDKKKRKGLEVIKKTRKQINDLLNEISDLNKALKVSKAKREEVIKIADKLQDIGPSGVAKADAICGVLADVTLMLTGAGYSSFDFSSAANCVSYLGLAADEATVLDDIMEAT